VTVLVNSHNSKFPFLSLLGPLRLHPFISNTTLLKDGVGLEEDALLVTTNFKLPAGLLWYIQTECCFALILISFLRDFNFKIRLQEKIYNHQVQMDFGPVFSKSYILMKFLLIFWFFILRWFWEPLVYQGPGEKLTCLFCIRERGKKVILKITGE